MRFKTFVREMTKLEMGRKYDRRRRLAEAKSFVDENVVTKARRRHRVKLVFKSNEGNRNYRRLVEGYLE